VNVKNHAYLEKLNKKKEIKKIEMELRSINSSMEREEEVKMVTETSPPRDYCVLKAVSTNKDGIDQKSVFNASQDSFTKTKESVNQVISIRN
jgi:hypothetical protein